MVKKAEQERKLLLVGTSTLPPGRKDCCFAHEDLHPSVTEVYGVLLQQRTAPSASKGGELGSHLVHTVTTERNLRKLALAICVGNPILLEGVTGSGKTTLIDEVARATNNFGTSPDTLLQVSFYIDS